MKLYYGYKGAGLFKNVLYSIFTLYDTTSRSRGKRADTPENKVIKGIIKRPKNDLVSPAYGLKGAADKAAINLNHDIYGKRFMAAMLSYHRNTNSGTPNSHLIEYIRHQLGSVEQIRHGSSGQNEPSVHNTAAANVIKSQSQHVLRNINNPGTATTNSSAPGQTPPKAYDHNAGSGT
ncbi:hypothetical protein EDD11_007046 [Mortierella claussenii]|nr:hypothetical protein EDD11_007046 [Mortierella claussenii]